MCIHIRILFGTSFNIYLPGHTSRLHCPVSVAEPLHGAPPFDAGVASGLVRVLVPPPQVAEQVDHSPYSPHMQSPSVISLILLTIAIIIIPLIHKKILNKIFTSYSILFDTGS